MPLIIAAYGSTDVCSFIVKAVLIQHDFVGLGQRNITKNNIANHAINFIPRPSKLHDRGWRYQRLALAEWTEDRKEEPSVEAVSMVAVAATEKIR